jgi:limonene-1,2-epoxide hydrolase
MTEQPSPSIVTTEHTENLWLTRKVLEFTQLMQELLPTAKRPEDWAPLEKFVAVDRFKRIGTFLETHDWQQYTAMLSQWASRTEKFETSLLRVAELSGHVYYEIEERHFRGDAVAVVNSMTVFEFDDEDKIHHLRVYLQQPQSPR